MQAFDELMAEFGPLLARVASTYEADSHRRDELMQDIALAVWQSLSRFEGNASLKTYVMRIAHNKAVNHVAYYAKRRATEVLSEEDFASQQSAVDESLAQQQRVDALMKAVRALPIQSRQVLTMSLEGLSYHDIAGITGLTSSHVGVILNRIKTQLSEQLQ